MKSDVFAMSSSSNTAAWMAGSNTCRRWTGSERPMENGEPLRRQPPNQGRTERGRQNQDPVPSRISDDSGGRILSDELQKMLRQLRPLAFIFVFEEHEGVPPALFLHALGPRSQLGIAVVWPPQPQVAPIGGR